MRRSALSPSFIRRIFAGLAIGGALPLSLAAALPEASGEVVVDENPAMDLQP